MFLLHVERKSYFPAVVPCSDTVACPDKYTCCKNGSDRWTCCPLEQVDTNTHKKFPHSITILYFPLKNPEAKKKNICLNSVLHTTAVSLQ